MCDLAVRKHKRRAKKLNSTCRSIARKILKERKNYSNAVARVKKGSQVAAAREAALQQYARFGCSSRTKSTSTRSQEPERKTLFERLFGGGDESISDGRLLRFQPHNISHRLRTDL